MIKLSIENGKLRIETEFTDRYLIRELPGASYHKNQNMWTAPLSWGSLVALRGLFGQHLDIGQDVVDWSWKEYRWRIEPCMKIRLQTELDNDDVPDTYNPEVDDGLFPFQQIGARFLAWAGQAILADPMGSGKTVQTIRSLRCLASTRDKSSEDYARGLDAVCPVVVVCPNTVKYVWFREFEKWWPEMRVTVVEGNITQRRKALKEDVDVYVISYDTLRAHSRLARFGAVAQRRCSECSRDLEPKEFPQRRCEHCPKELNDIHFRTFVADEAHRLCNPAAKQTRAAWAVAHTAEYRFALTGTPISDHPGEFWSIGHLVSPSEFPAKTKYIDRYTEKSFNFFGGMEILGLKAENRQEFFKIVDPRFRRMPQEWILPQLPPVQRQERYIDMSPKQARVYREMETRMAARFEQELLLAPNPLTRTLRLLQLASAYAEVTYQEDGTPSVILTDPSNKVEALVELLDEMGDEPLVVGSASKQLINLAAARLDKLGVACGTITGDVCGEERGRIISSFQNGELRVVLGTVDAAGEGITLTRARQMCWLSRHWSAIKNEQFEARIRRIGSESHSSVEYIDLISRGTIESRQREVLGDKLGRLEELVRDKESLIRLLGIVERVDDDQD